MQVTRPEDMRTEDVPTVDVPTEDVPTGDVLTGDLHPTSSVYSVLNSLIYLVRNTILDKESLQIFPFDGLN